MTASATETAILAFVAALAAVARPAPDAVLPQPSRNEDMVSRLAEIGDGSDLADHLNVLDGDRANVDEMLGADLAAVECYDIVHHVRVEYAVAGGDSATREARFDLGRIAIFDAVKPVVSGATVTCLGGAVAAIALVDFLPHTETVAYGLPNVKACEFVFALTFTSQRPF